VLIADSFFSRGGFAFGFRWLHVVAGIMWIGLLYYFNFVQVPSFAAYGNDGDGPKARNIALNILARRALWWFRWAAVATFLTGLVIIGLTKNYFSDSGDGHKHSILTGMLLGTIMLLNVWGVIWRNQKVVLANAANVLAGQAADPGAAAAGRRAAMASRQNTIFSVSMVWFMTFSSHFANAYVGGADQSLSAVALYWIIVIVIVGVLELNALQLLPWKGEVNKGLNVLYDGPKVRNPLIAAFGLWLVFLLLWEIVLQNS
jgi:uncharacterized membrane protein